MENAGRVEIDRELPGGIIHGGGGAVVDGGLTVKPGGTTSDDQWIICNNNSLFQFFFHKTKLTHTFKLIYNFFFLFFRRQLICAGYHRRRCYARAHVTPDGILMIPPARAHWHPPDPAAQGKAEFTNALRVTRMHSLASSQAVYDNVAQR